MTRFPVLLPSAARGRASMRWGVSLAAMAAGLSAGPVQAQTLATLRAVLGQGGVPSAATAALAAGSPYNPAPASPAMLAALARAAQNQGHLATAVSLAEQAQSAARAAALAMQPQVPNGLAPGGLQIAPGLTTAANDPVGVHTWQGANLPTTDPGNANNVTIVQTAPQAVLSWTTFNVGQQTTLNFQQQSSWVALNRVVGQLDPSTGLRNPALAPAPSQILGAINAPGTVLVINQNGILFSPTAQINVNTLIATSLEIGNVTNNTSFPPTLQNISQRDLIFLQYGLLGQSENNPNLSTFSAQAGSLNGANEPVYDVLEGTVQVDAGATITTGASGYALLLAPRVINAGQITSPQGQVSLVSGRAATLVESAGDANSVDPNLRGRAITAVDVGGFTGDYVDNQASALISVPGGYTSLQATPSGAVLDAGVLASTTSVSLNGYVNIQGGNIQLAPDAVIAITPDMGPATIPQSPGSVGGFKTSLIRIGDTTANIAIGADSLIYAPSATISIGADPGETGASTGLSSQPSRVFVDTGAVIDAAGVPDVEIPASSITIQINPVTQNDLANAPLYRNSFLDGSTVTVDPRLSGVRADGVAWVGSPLISAAAYYQQVGVTASELMTAGGNVTLGAAGVPVGGQATQAPDVIVKAGATIDISGGWRTFQAGMVQTTKLIDSSGNIVDIGSADPNDIFVGVFNGYTTAQPRWGIVQTFNNPILSGAHFEAAYTEGRDAGSLTLKASAIVLDGQVYADAFPGPQQLANAQVGTASGSVYGDVRALQAAPSQLPAGGYLNIQALGLDTNTTNPGYTGGGDIDIVAGADYAPLPGGFAYGQDIGFAPDGSLIVPARPAASLLPTSRLDVISLNADALSAMGLSQLSVQTSGAISVAQNANVTLAAGGAFEATAGRSITINGRVTAPSGSIDMATANFGALLDNTFGGSVFVAEPITLGSFDIAVNGQLSAAGRWTNDYNAQPGALIGSAWQNGGEITLYAAPRIAPLDQQQQTTDPNPNQSEDDSGSILLNVAGALNVTGGGYVAPNGALSLSAKGGDVALFDETTYFQINNDPQRFPGGLSGFRVNGIVANDFGPPDYLPVNPSVINARVVLAPGSILAHGFGGGGTFNLTTPAFSFGDGAVATGTALPLDFFSATGFSSYNIKSYATDLMPNNFDNGYGGYNAVLATQVLTIAAGQTLNLSESMFSPLPSAAQVSQLRGFATGGDLNSILTPIVPTDAWDARPVNLSLGGLMELHVDPGGQVIGQAGGVLSVGELYNEGVIRIPGGTLSQAEVLPSLYSGSGVSNGSIPTEAIGVKSLSDVFTVGSDGLIHEGDNNALDLTDNSGMTLTNAQVAANDYIYLLGDIPSGPVLGGQGGQGVLLAPGSVTDLSGEAIVNPRAAPLGGAPVANFVDGIVVGGGSLRTAVSVNGGALFQASPSTNSVYAQEPATTQTVAAVLTAQPGSTIDLAGANAVFDEPVASTVIAAGGPAPAYAPTAVWSNGGSLTLGSGGGVITGAVIDAHGGAAAAQGGTLTLIDPTLYQTDPALPAVNAISAAAIEQAGFDTLVAEGGLNSAAGAVTLTLRGALFVTDRPQDVNFNVSLATSRDAYAPVIGSGGALTINASYVGLQGGFQGFSTPAYGTTGNNSVTLNAGAIDVTGAVLFDQSVGQVTLSSAGDLRLIGVQPWQLAFNTTSTANPSLVGQLAVNGNLTITAAQVYPTTGTTFTITSVSPTGLIDIERAGSATPPTPYSAGGALTIQADAIQQNGVVRVPLGSLTLGGDAPLTFVVDNSPVTFAPVTQTLNVGAGGVTSVSTDGLVIPYGTTADQIEWYFNPTNTSPLTGPPAAVLQMAGANVNVASGATVDLKGGGDVYAYEFIAGTGGSRDVLSQFNTDSFTSDGGYQYPDHRSIYAIVPGLANAPAAPYDPIYSANYAGLYGPSQVGQRVYLSAAPGLAAGWYTLLPAQYALLPGGMRVVQDTGAATPAPGAAVTLADGTDVVAGYFGVAGSGAYQSTPVVFDVQSQAVIRNEADIALTYGNATFTADAVHAGTAVPRLPIDAGRLILTPIDALAIAGTFDTAPAAGGRGSEVDITGQSLEIVGAGQGGSLPGAIVLTDASLEDLNAASLLLGAVRTDNADGSTSLQVSTNVITVDYGSSLTAPEILMATDGQNAALTIADGASVTANGAVSDTATGVYHIDGLVTNADGSQTRVQSAQGQFLRVSDGPQRLVVRSGEDATVTPGALTMGAATLAGAAAELESSDGLTIAPKARLDAPQFAIGATNVTFGAGGGGQGGLVITPALQALLGQTQSLTIQSENPLNFQAGTYGFGAVTFDAPGLADQGGGPVTVNATTLQLANSGVAPLACGAAGAATCGTGALALDANQIVFQTGSLQTYGFGGGVSLTAPQGVLFDGVGGLNVGPANLVITTPFLGDRGTGVAGAAPPNLTLASAGAVQISSPGGTNFTAPAGTPGSVLTIDGQTIDVSGASLRATAGALTLSAQDGLTVANGAVIATPGYAETLGDPATPTTVQAPGGALTLVTANGDIAVDPTSVLSIAGGQGQAGSLTLSAHNGAVLVSNASFDTGPAGSGASLTLDTGAVFDLASFAQGPAAAFSGSIAIRSGSGDLVLNSGETLKATNVQLVADGGVVGVSGTIDVSGVNGGDVNLYGETGVHLASGSLIDAHANGYGLTDTRQASGGNVTLGVDGTGAITVDPGAVIDVAAINTANRLVPMARDNGVYYSYVAGDQGGTITFRAPVVTAPSGAETVNVNFAGAADGASSVVLEGFQRFDLTAFANVYNANCWGVCIVGGQAILNLAASTTGLANPLSDPNGPVVQFVQNFDVSADYGNLGGLASQANFHARPGMEFDYSGDIILQSNWNLGAGTVNIAGAVAAGLMAPAPGVAGQYYVIPGDEAAVFSDYTTLLYRVGGSVTGEPGVLTLRAGGSLDLKGSITDGFFQFHDQTDPNYLNHVLGGGAIYYQAQANTDCSHSDCSNIGQWTAHGSAKDYVAIDFPGGIGGSAEVNPAPYSPAANGADAAGDALLTGVGDPLGSAQLFPLVSDGAGGEKAVASWSYQLVAGADVGGAGGRPSVNPLATLAGSDHTLTVEGQNVYGYQATKGSANLIDSLLLGLTNSDGSVTPLTPDQWLQAFQASTGLGDGAYTQISFAKAPGSVKSALEALAKKYFGANPKNATVGKDSVTTSLKTAADFMAFVSANFSKVGGGYKLPKPKPSGKTIYATAPTLVRTGTGDIEMAASGTIDLSNGPPMALDEKTGKLVAPTAFNPQLGGAAVYTAGHLAQLGAVLATDVVSGQMFTVDLNANEVTTDNIATVNPKSYGYGKGSVAGIMITDPVYTTGGGNVDLNAGGDVLSRRDVSLELALGDVYGNQVLQDSSWIGTGAQPWRTGSIGVVVNALINPQLFKEGLANLGGGDISVTAGGSISDLSVVSTTALTTASVAGGAGGGQPASALVTLGGGAVDVTADADILGGRLDVASGVADVRASGDLAAAGSTLQGGASGAGDNLMRLRLSDASISIEAGGTVALQGATALGVTLDPGNSAGGQEDADSLGFYSPAASISIIANGSININDAGQDIISLNSPPSIVYPGTLIAHSLTGNLNLQANNSQTSRYILLYPSPTGELSLIAGGNIAPVSIAMLDADPSVLPGAFTTYSITGGAGLDFAFPTVLPNTSDVMRRLLHNPNPTHAGDTTPNQIIAGGDITDLIFSSPKMAQISAGQDLINTVFFGQNLSPTDVTRITAGRDIIGTTVLEQAIVNGSPTGPMLPAVQGNTFVVGGPGSFFLEAGRDAGPFLNSAVTDGYAYNDTSRTGVLTWAGGIQSVGNLWNPWLPAQGASLFTEFGVAKGQNFAGLIASYLNPAGFAADPDYLFEQSTDANGVITVDRNAQIYSLDLISWLRSIAPSILAKFQQSQTLSGGTAQPSALVQIAQTLQAGGTVSLGQALAALPLAAYDRMPLIPWLQLNYASLLTSQYGTLDVSYSQAFATFQGLPTLNQRAFLLEDVYFNELVQTSIPASPSYLQYSRGYLAVNTLFPAALGYTQNDLTGGANGANAPVVTGNLDLRLATIQTDQGGDIVVLGPGGSILAGSTVATAQQAARRVYAGGYLFGGVPAQPVGILPTGIPETAEITQIPAGFEGILTLQQGDIDGFTDGSLLLNQSRLFTEGGGDIALWSSNADLNAGQGPRSSADFPPVVVHIDENGFATVDAAAGVTGAGIAAFQPDPTAAPPDVFLIAPRGTVDAGAAGVRSAGNLFIAAFQVANATGFQAQGSISGVQSGPAVNVAAQTSASAASAAAAQAASAAASSNGGGVDRTLITVDVLGYVAGLSDDASDEDQRRKKEK